MANKEKNFASAVIYVHNAEKRIEKFLESIITIMEENFEHSEIICVNDFSSDRSLECIKKISEKAENTSISVVNMSCFHGLELAMNAGVDMSIGDFVFEFDNTNLDFESEVVMQIYNHSLQGYDIVSAVPEQKNRVSSRVFYKVFNMFSEIPTEMTTESFRVLSRRVINRITSMNKTTPYRKVIYANCGLKTDALKYKVVENDTGAMDKKERDYRSSLAVDSLILFTDIGYQFSKTMSVVMICMTLVVLIYSIVAFVISNPIEGWTSTVLFLSVAFFGLFTILTMVIKYLQIIIGLVFKRRYYNFESIEKLTK